MRQLKEQTNILCKLAFESINLIFQLSEYFHSKVQSFYCGVNNSF